MNHDQIEFAIEHAINALALAKLALSKSALPMFSESDVLHKVNDPRDEPKVDPLALLADAERRLERLEAARDYDAQHRKTFPRVESR